MIYVVKKAIFLTLAMSNMILIKKASWEKGNQAVKYHDTAVIHMYKNTSTRQHPCQNITYST